MDLWSVGEIAVAVVATGAAIWFALVNITAVDMLTNDPLFCKKCGGTAISRQAMAHRFPWFDCPVCGVLIQSVNFHLPSCAGRSAWKCIECGALVDTRHQDGCSLASQPVVS